MPLAPVSTFGLDILQPWNMPDKARTMAVNLAAGTYAKGTVLGEVVSATSVNEVQTLTPTGTISGGTFTLTVDGVTTAALVFNATAAAIVAAINLALGGIAVSATGGPISTTPVVLTFINDYAARDVGLIVVNSSLTGSTPLVTPTETTKGIAAKGTFKTYASGNSDGSQVAKAILQTACVVDGQGRITANSELGNFYRTASVYVSGSFLTSELVGLDANAITN